MHAATVILNEKCSTVHVNLILILQMRPSGLGLEQLWSCLELPTSRHSKDVFSCITIHSDTLSYITYLTFRISSAGLSHL